MIKKLKERKCKNKSCGKMFTPIRDDDFYCSYDCWKKVNVVNGKIKYETLRK